MGIVKERSEVLSHYDKLKKELYDLEQKEKDFLRYNFDYFKSVFDIFRSHLNKFLSDTKQEILDITMHTSEIRRTSVERMTRAGSDLLRAMELSCQGLIKGFTGQVA